MDNVYAMELLQQSLTNAREGEHELTLKLQAAQEEIEELKREAMTNKTRFQELDEALEVEEARTNVESLAKQEAEETSRQHRAEASKAKRKETIANKHCDAAEAEILKLQKDWSSERSAVVAADRLSCRLREDIGLAKLNEKVVLDQLTAARIKVCTLQEDLEVAIDRITMLECQARRFEDSLKEDHQRMEEAEKTLGALTYELEKTRSTLGETLEKYDRLEAKHSKREFALAVTATAFDPDRPEIDKEPPVHHESKPSAGPNHQREQVPEIERSMEKTAAANVRLRKAKDQAIVGPKLPTLPEPAILRPILTSVTSCHVEVFMTPGRIVAVPRANLKKPLWKCFWRFPSNSLYLLFRGSGRR